MVDSLAAAPVTRTISSAIYDCLIEGWDAQDVDDIALVVVNALSPQPDPDDPCKWTITLPSADHREEVND
jgi:hypothetical protein